MDTCQPSDIVTESLLRDYLHKDHPDAKVNDSEENTVAAEFLEEVGAVTVASQQWLDSNCVNDAIDDEGQDQPIPKEERDGIEQGPEVEPSFALPISKTSGTEKQQLSDGSEQQLAKPSNETTATTEEVSVAGAP
jgi:hypothetical protein